MIEFCVYVILLYNQIRVHIGRAIFFLNTQVISYNWNIVESGIKHHQTNKQKPTQAISYFFNWLIKPFYMHILRRNVLWHCIVLPLNNFTRLLQMVVWGSVNFLAIFHFCHSTGIFMKLYSMKSSVLYTCHALTSTIFLLQILQNFTRLLRMMDWGSVYFLLIFHFCRSIFIELYLMKNSLLYIPVCRSLTSTFFLLQILQILQDYINRTIDDMTTCWITYLNICRQVSGFLRVIWYPPPIKLTATI